MSPSGQSILLLIRRLLHPSTLDFDLIRGRFFAQVLLKFWTIEDTRTAAGHFINGRNLLHLPVVIPYVVQ